MNKFLRKFDFKVKTFKMVMSLFIVMLAFPSFVVGAEQEFVTSLTDETRELNGAYELHITAESNPLTNSTVSLNHEDAWLFFDNIKPSEVVANYLDDVLVNGEAFVKGANGRVAIYAHGTVLMPHSPSFKPLTVYTEEAFGGESAQYGLHTFYTSLGTKDNAIKSFKLKRGYMATFANNSDGSGYSRVFIADESDIEFSVAPDKLYGSVSFIRVFKHQWVTKKGHAGWDPNLFNCTTYYDWNIGGSTSDDYEYAAIRQNAGWPGWSEINNKQDISHLLGFNEPDRPDQSNIPFDDALAMWPQFMQSGLRLGAPATSDPWNGWSLFNFVDKCDELNYRLDYIAIHCYWAKSAQQWYDELKYIHERTGRPIWITEWNNGANWTTEWWPNEYWDLTDGNVYKQLNDMKGILNVLDTASFVERYFLYEWVEPRRECLALIDSAILHNSEVNPSAYTWLDTAEILHKNGSGKNQLGVWVDTLDVVYTPFGSYFKENKSQLAYKSHKEVIPHWNYSAPSLAYRYLTASKSIRLALTDSNGELSKSHRIEKKINDGAYEIIYESADVSNSVYLDPLDANINGAVTYRFSIETSDGSFLKSDEVTYFQSGGDDFQVAKLQVKSPEWATCLFSKKYDSAPLAYIGLPTFNNVVAITKRANTVSTTSFKFILDPWDYISNPTFNSTDDLSVMALPAGVYNFGGLKGISAQVSSIARDWVTVTFEEAFEEVPVVFCTQASNSNSYPTNVAIRNVSTTGFEVSIRSEEDITASMIGEKVNYFAIETGQGVIEGKRVTVGKTEEGSGLTSTPMLVEYDETYSEPAFFGGLQTVVNDFASTVRYYVVDDNSIKILKQREMSGSLSAVGEDELAWMIIDTATDQPTAIKNPEASNFDFWPNPTEDVLNFGFDKVTLVSIYDLTGTKVLEQEVSNTLDVRVIPTGIYVIKVDDAVKKFIKK